MKSPPFALCCVRSLIFEDFSKRALPEGIFTAHGISVDQCVLSFLCLFCFVLWFFLFFVVSLLCLSPPVFRVGCHSGIPPPSVFVSAHLPITCGRLSNEITFPRQRIDTVELSGTYRHCRNWLASKSAAGGLAGGGEGGSAPYKSLLPE